MISGGLCGFAGLLLVGGTDHTITTTIAGGRGFTAVMVAWLAKFNPLMMVFTSLLLVFLSRGASEITTIYGLNHSFGDILTGMTASLLAQGMEPFAACCCAVWLHGRAGDLAAAEKGRRGMTPGDLLEKLPYALKEVE